MLRGSLDESDCARAWHKASWSPAQAPPSLGLLPCAAPQSPVIAPWVMTSSCSLPVSRRGEGTLC